MRPATPADTRRTRLPVGIAAVIALVVLATSFPLGELLSQHRLVAAEAAQLSQVQHQNANLAKKRAQLSSPDEIKRIARKTYQMVPPGQTLYVVLPPPGKAATGSAAPLPGDPGSQPLYGPNSAPGATPDPGLPTTPGPGSPAAARPTAPASSGGFWSRVTSTLEFWR